MGLTDGPTQPIASQYASDKALLQAPKIDKEQVEAANAVVKDATSSHGKRIANEEQAGTGTVSWKTYKTWIKAASALSLAMMLIFLIVGQSASQYATVLVTHWSQDKYGWTMKESGAQTDLAIMCRTPPVGQEKLCNGVGVVSALPESLQTIGLASVMTCFAQEPGASLPDIPAAKASNNYLYVYLGTLVATVILSYFGNVLLSHFTLTASKKLHNTMVAAVLRSPMAFFDTTPQGRIINRVSKDTDAVDVNIFSQFSPTLNQALIVVGMVITMAVVSWPSLIVLVPCVIIFFAIASRFRVTAPQIKRLNNVTRSPVFSNCNETVDCLVCIRAYEKQQDFTDQFRFNVRVNTATYWYSLALNRWLAFRIGLICAALSVLVTLVSVLIAPFSIEIA